MLGSRSGVFAAGPAGGGGTRWQDSQKALEWDLFPFKQMPE